MQSDKKFIIFANKNQEIKNYLKMEKEEITIETLKELTFKNLQTVKSVYMRCENEAKNGRNEVLFIEYFPPLLIAELLSFGFKINQSRNNFGELVTNISW